MKFLASLPLGFVMCSIGLSAVAGGVEEGFQILVISVVCTAGIALAIWIPLWWVVGWVTMGIAGSIMGRKTPPAGKSPMVRDADVLANYIKAARAQGLAEEDIDRALRQHGWREGFIRETRRSLDDRAG